MPISVSLLPTRFLGANELVDVCLRLKRLGIHAMAGHNGPNGSIDICGDELEAEIKIADKLLAIGPNPPTKEKPSD